MPLNVIDRINIFPYRVIPVILLASMAWGTLGAVEKFTLVYYDSRSGVTIRLGDKYLKCYRSEARTDQQPCLLKARHLMDYESFSILFTNFPDTRIELPLERLFPLDMLFSCFPDDNVVCLRRGRIGPYRELSLAWRHGGSLRQVELVRGGRGSFKLQELHLSMEFTRPSGHTSLSSPYFENLFECLHYLQKTCVYPLYFHQIQDGHTITHPNSGPEGPSDQPHQGIRSHTYRLTLRDSQNLLRQNIILQHHE